MTSEDSRFSFHSREPEQTRRAGCALAGALPRDGIVLSLSGGLGAGKTQFVKGLAEGLGLDPDMVTSPTFAIVNEYPASAGLPLIHMDFYRLESEMALEEVGFLDLLAVGAVFAIEWGDRFPGSLPADRMEIQLDRKIASENEAPHPTTSVENSPREFRVAALGPVSLETLRNWRDSQPWKSVTEPARRI